MIIYGRHGYVVHKSDTIRSNSYVVSYQGRNVLIDAGVPGEMGTILREIRRTGRRSVDAIFLTHNHWDHVYNAEAFSRKFHCPVYGLPESIHSIGGGFSRMPKGFSTFGKMMAKGERLIRPFVDFSRYPGCSYVRPLTDRVVKRYLGPEAGLVFVPGHTKDSVAFGLCQEVIIAGDALIGGRKIFPPFGDSEEEILASWRKMLYGGYGLFCPGHGLPVRRKKLITSYRRERKEREAARQRKLLLHRAYRKLDSLPTGKCSDKITDGCLILEGGAFRGVYTSGVIDALMLNDINFRCTIGVSAGAMNGYTYAAGEIGAAGRINLMYRHDSRYVGIHALRKNKGVIGFQFLFEHIIQEMPFDESRILKMGRRFVAVATDCTTGKPAYFEQGNCPDILKAIQASASMPLLSKMVNIQGKPYLDGGCSEKVPVEWALQQGYEKIVVVRTRDKQYRQPPVRLDRMEMQQRVYKKYPEFYQGLRKEAENYNALCDRMDELEAQGRIFVLYPSEPLSIGVLEGDMDKLGSLYRLGYNDTLDQMLELKKYIQGN